MADLSGRTLGEFILREPIGRGGFGTVYRAEQPLLEREVVVKVLHEEHGDSVSRERFMREARLAAQLRHPHAVHVYTFGAADDGRLLWIAMERVQGVSLSDWLKQHGPMPLELFVPFFDDVCDVVDAAHDKGLLHRDLKPSNIMVVRCKGRLIPKLLDLGIARESGTRHSEIEADDAELGPGEHRDADAADADAADDVDDVDGDHDTDRDGDTDPFGAKTDRLAIRPLRAGRTVADYHSSQTRRRLTPPNATLGSSAYMAPDLWGGAELAGPEADVYALGIIAYQTLTGRLPFVADRTEWYHDQHGHAPVPPLGDGFPPGLDAAIQGALKKHPRYRTKTALDLSKNVQKALRTSRREQLRISAQLWLDERCRPGFLWGADVVEETVRSVPGETLGGLERVFLKDSQQRIRRARWLRRALVALAALALVGGLLYLHRAATRAQQARLETQLAQEQAKLAQEQARSARAVVEATITQAEVDQGNSELIHDEPDASLHLGRAYQRGDHSPSTTFMLARALQPRLAEQARLQSTAGRMWSAAFSPDGRQIVTTDDRAAQVWDAQTYQRRFTLFHGDTVYQALYSADGARIVTAGNDSTVKIWDAASGALVRELRRDGSKQHYFIVALSPDGRLVAAIDTRGDVAHVWDATTGAPIAELHNDGLEFPGLAFSPNGRWLVTTGGGDVRVFDVRTWRQVATIRGLRIHRLAFDPTGARLATGAATGDVSIWEIPSGARIQHLRDAGKSVDAVAFSPDGRLIAAGSRDGVVQIWRGESGELQSQLSPCHCRISAVEFDRTSSLVLAADADGTVVVAEASEGMSVAVLDGPQSVLTAHFDRDSRRVVGASLDGTARVWDATPAYRRWRSLPVGDNCGLNSEPDRRFVAVGCKDRPTRVWDTARGQLLAELPGVTPVAGDFASASPAVSGAGDRAAIARGHAVDVYELPGGRLLRTIVHGAAVNAVAFGGTTTGRNVVSGAVDGSLLVTRDDGSRLALPAAPGGVDAAGFLSNGRVVAADAQRRLRVYDPAGAVLADLEIPARVMSLRVDGNRLVALPIYTGSATPPLLVDLEHYRVVTQLEGHVGRVFSARWVTGGQILTAGADGTARLWDGTTGKLRHIYRGGSRILADATLTSDGLVMAGGAGRLWFWDQGRESLLWALPAHTSQIVAVHVEGGDIVTRGFTGELARWTLPNPGRVIEACSDHKRCAMLLR
ncbi:MAG TPA: protein kinase [Kofleriaceae bacterium]|jgi:WD40 repeat protein/serine/threonine protein kinase|nr:protein kinase [Kofleriaceae bacterium]